MPETSKNKWIAVVIALVIAAFFFGAVFFYSFNSKVNSSLDTASQIGLIATSTAEITSMTASATNTPTQMSTTTTSPEGLIIEEQTIGTGATATAGQQVAVHYTGTLTNGTKFDSSYDRGQPIVFALGTGQVIKGWDLGIAGMKVGGKRKLTIPAALAYGDQVVGGGMIPANSTLIFDVELVGVK
jgi:FKBP-type peptidyl-prolyl cis-trans isomerase